MDYHFTQFVDKFKQDLSSDKEKCVISWEVYGPNTYLDDKRERPEAYFLWYLTDRGYKYEIHEEKKQVNDVMEGWVTQCIRYITIQLK
jgi:hypothetical protein